MKHKNYDINELRAFFEVARQGSFQLAARALSLSPSALSRRITNLEAVLEVRLFARTTRSVQLTQAGQTLQREALPLLTALDGTLQGVALQAQGHGGTLAFSCISSAAFSLFPQALRQFRQRYPGVHIALHDSTGLRVQHQVLTGRVSFGLTTLCGQHRELYAEPCLTDPYVLMVPLAHPWRSRASVSWRELHNISALGWPLVGLGRSSANRRQIDEMLEKQSITVPWFDEVENLSSTLGLLRAGGSAVVMPRLALEACGEWGLACLPLVEPRITRTIALIRRREAQLSDGERQFWRLLSEHLRQLQQNWLRMSILLPEDIREFDAEESAR